MREHYVYKYQKPSGEIVYIGKTNSSLKARIEAHRSEPEFAMHLGECEIYCAKLSNDVETDAVEALLIQKYSPKINKVFRRDTPGNVDIGNLTWIPYSEYVSALSVSDSELGALKKAARASEEFINAVADAYEAHEVSILTPELSAQGFADFPWGREPLTHCKVEKTEGGYLHLLTPFARYASEHRELAVYEAWRPYINGVKLPRGSEESVAIFDALEGFAEELREFRENGFREGEHSEEYVLHVPDIPAIRIYFSGMFSNMSKTANGRVAAEVAPDSYQALPAIESQIAADKMAMLRKMGML